MAQSAEDQVNRLRYEYERIFHGCARKVQHATIKDAERHIASINKRKGDQNLHVYLCEVCGRYHVGHHRGKK